MTGRAKPAISGPAMPPALPIVDMSPLLRPGPAAELDVPARAIAAACRAHGFFYVVGHGVEQGLDALPARGVHREEWDPIAP